MTAGSTSRPAQQATRTIPIAMAVVTDLLGNGLVASPARPGDNLIGVSIGAAELAGKRLRLLDQALSRVSRVAVLWHVANPDKALEWQRTQQAA